MSFMHQGRGHGAPTAANAFWGYFEDRKRFWWQCFVFLQWGHSNWSKTVAVGVKTDSIFCSGITPKGLGRRKSGTPLESRQED